MKDLVLYHHGIKGMKWGVRRTPEQLGHLKETAKRKTSVIGERNKGEINSAKGKLTSANETAITKALKLGLKRKQEEDLSKYSDEELRAMNNRMTLENNYRRLTDERNKSEGREIVTDLLASSGGIILSAATTVAATEMVRYLLKNG